MAAGPQLPVCLRVEEDECHHPAVQALSLPSWAAPHSGSGSAATGVYAGPWHRGHGFPGLPSTILSCLEFSLRETLLGGQSGFRVDIPWASSPLGPRDSPGGSRLSSLLLLEVTRFVLHLSYLSVSLAPGHLLRDQGPGVVSW